MQPREGYTFDTGCKLGRDDFPTKLHDLEASHTHFDIYFLCGFKGRGNREEEGIENGKGFGAIW